MKDKVVKYKISLYCKNNIISDSDLLLSSAATGELKKS